MVLNLGWVPRDQNEEADALTNCDFAAIDTSRRLHVNVAEIVWLTLPRMLEVAEQIFDRVRKSKADGGPPRASAPHVASSFRQRHPW